MVGAQSPAAGRSWPSVAEVVPARGSRWSRGVVSGVRVRR
jgi:hypothetical protein